MKNECIDLFKNLFSKEPELCCFAPGRVNLIGEHIDYNGGHVFPCAINKGIYCAAGKRSDKSLRMYSAQFCKDGVVTVQPEEFAFSKRSWVNYPMSVVCTLERFGYPVNGGADLVFIGDLPDGAGLSSSAALEVLTGRVLAELFDIPLSGQLLALIGQFAENRFIGVNCGIMDQFASSMGMKDNAILLDTNSLEFSYAPIPEDKAGIVIVNSGVKHSLASSAYNERRKQCESALSDVRRYVDVNALCQLSAKQFNDHKDKITDTICRKRAAHVVSENLRTISAADALRNGDLEVFGKLMNESHISLRDDYEVSCEELDYLAENAWELEGVFGARMTGGGFGGCTVNLVRSEYEELFSESIKSAYKRKYNREPEIFIVGISSGASRIE